MKEQIGPSISIFLWLLLLCMAASGSGDNKSFMEYRRMLPKDFPIPPSAPNARGNNPPLDHPQEYQMEKGMEGKTFFYPQYYV